MMMITIIVGNNYIVQHKGAEFMSKQCKRNEWIVEEPIKRERKIEQCKT